MKCWLAFVYETQREEVLIRWDEGIQRYKYSTDGFWSIFSRLDGEGLSPDVPSQTEMTLIYQSAAWILAGILLAVVIFLLVAVLVNRRKNWVQMSCYGAPKKVSDSELVTQELTTS